MPAAVNISHQIEARTTGDGSAHSGELEPAHDPGRLRTRRSRWYRRPAGELDTRAVTRTSHILEPAGHHDLVRVVVLTVTGPPARTVVEVCDHQTDGWGSCWNKAPQGSTATAAPHDRSGPGPGRWRPEHNLCRCLGQPHPHRVRAGQGRRWRSSAHAPAGSDATGRQASAGPRHRTPASAARASPLSAT